MERKTPETWKAILLAAFCGLAVLILLAGSGLALAGGIADWKETEVVSTSLLPAFMTISALLLAAALIGWTGWLSLRHARNQPGEAARLHPMSTLRGILIFAGWVLAILLAVFLVDRPVLQWLSLPFYLAAVGLPVYGLIRLGAGGLNPGSKLRAWGTLTGGMTIAPLMSGLAEGLALLILLIPVGIYFGIDPGRLGELQAMLEKFKNIGTQEEIFSLLAPVLTNPLALIGGLFFLGVVTPLVEETAKSLPVWLSWGSLDSPAQGFALGALSGAGFGLMEGLLISSTPGTSWGATLAVRAASSAMHIITSGLVGWGIGIAAAQKRALPALARYLLAVFIHGIWNACVVLLVFAGGLTLASGTTINIGAGVMAVLGLGMLSLLILAAPFALWGLNRHFQKSNPASAEPGNTQPPASGNMVI